MMGNSLELTVKDNGNGIPQNIVGYDIIKAHGGEIKVESKEGEETTFVIILPGKMYATEA